MRVQARFRPAAAADVEDAYKWYETRLIGLGGQFLEAVDDAVNTLVERPLAYAVVHRTVRRILLRRFPYGLFYVVDSETVEVIACFHVRRDPARWRTRRA